ncbi:TPA: hypothetical protein N0F65_005491 [Lagenidium giganteum]|uniref:Xaa-Pro dipeptidyl-peptidase C-terminal domain-containing protein n=1 Tax=Lagenidium giganteum TaxID=4803 RepID=A0AAV2YFS6_9STRA|nr:TPA: hypothetical protein N0F65_005491 [Lagenidium giganteum]
MPEMSSLEDDPREIAYRVRVDDNVWIPLNDGTRLSARLWMPEPMGDGSPWRVRFAVVLEYLPYRKSDWTAPRDARNHDWLAQRGFAVARVDIRGSGNSDGDEDGEYTAQELQDGLEVIAWLAKQEWCNGNVGMFGKSWGGFNGLQMAALRPPALKGIVSLNSIDDRYADDIHYMGGCVVGSEALSWATVMLAWNARPPAPETSGATEEAWRERWRRRLERHRPWLHDWLAHQARDDFWRHGSICEDFSAVECPVLAIGGWADGYHNGVFRMIAGIDGTKGLRKGIIGPWSHEWPNVATPGPQVGFLDICKQWWDHCLYQEPTDVTKLPDLQVYVKDTLPNPSAQVREYPGYWKAIERVEGLHQLYKTFDCLPDRKLVEHGAVRPSSSSSTLSIRSHSLHGVWSGEWLSFGGPDMPGDQMHEDALALSWSSDTLDQPLEVIGFPEVHLTVQSTTQQALIMVRLCDVDPATGSSTLVSRGVLNLSHRRGHAPEHLEHMPINTWTPVKIKLNSCAYRIASGRRLLLAVTPSYWPMVWPSPQQTTLTIGFHGENTLRLPVASGSMVCPVQTPAVHRGGSANVEQLREGKPMERRFSIVHSNTDDGGPRQQLDVVEDDGVVLLPREGITMEESGHKRYTIDRLGLNPHVSIKRKLIYEKRPEKTSRAETEREATPFTTASGLEDSLASGLDRDSPPVWFDHAEFPKRPWKAVIETNSTMHSDEHSLHLHDELRVELNGEPFFLREWTKVIPRSFV